MGILRNIVMKNAMWETYKLFNFLIKCYATILTKAF